MPIFRNVMLELSQAKDVCENCRQVTDTDELHPTVNGKMCQPCVENPSLK